MYCTAGDGGCRASKCILTKKCILGISLLRLGGGSGGKGGGEGENNGGNRKRVGGTVQLWTL